MRYVVLGAGLQGSACAYDLLTHTRAARIAVADLSLEDLPPFLERLRRDERLELIELDARDERAVRRVLEGADACMNALPYYFNLEMTRLAIDSGAHYCDLGGNTEIVFEQLELDADAKARRVSVIPDCGLAPGMVNILAAAAIREMDETDVVRISVGGLPQDPKPPLNYQIVYSLEGVLDYYTTDSWVVRDGQPARVEALTEIESVEFPEPVGTLEAFHTAGGLSTMPWTHEGEVRRMEYKTLRYPGHARAMKTIRDLGLLSLEPVTVGDVEVVPRDVFIACVDPRLRDTRGRDLVALRVEAEGAAGGRRQVIRYELIDYYDEETGISAMERTTGFSLAITGAMQAEREIDRAGVFTPDVGVPADRYIAALAERGVVVRRTT